MNELHPLTRARVYVQDLINGRRGDWWGYSNSQNVRTHAKESSQAATNDSINLRHAYWRKEVMNA
jgi:hypothetical protein